MVKSLKQHAGIACVEMCLDFVPDSMQFKVMGFNPSMNALKTRVKEKALKGRANNEIIEELNRLFHAKAKIVAGNKSRKKEILLKGILENQAIHG